MARIQSYILSILVAIEKQNDFRQEKASEANKKK